MRWACDQVVVVAAAVVAEPVVAQALALARARAQALALALALALMGRPPLLQLWRLRRRAMLWRG